MKFYKYKNDYLVAEVKTQSANCISLPDDIIDSELLKQQAYVINQNNQISLSPEYFCKKNLAESDWKVTRHRDQQALGIETSLTEEEYQILLEKRQEWRNTINRIQEEKQNVE